ncbi:copper chaperone PCu(A)C [Jannaschia marina]|uniref:copper chaperone PCu(A)C n=1 Tax=Jannaschia marina TaxID=2741674 RepID=UPI0015CDB668|nr:copper chaperone PCu(A)C [Jannaschia marina]
MRISLPFAVFLAVFPLSAAAEPVTLGDLSLDAPMLRATPPNAPVAGGYITIENRGDADDTLVAAAISEAIAGEVQLHTMTMNDGVMEMSQVEGGIPIPAGETVQLMPGGLHLMLMGLAQPLTAGESHEITLTFETAGEITLDAPVLTLGEIREATGAEGGHGGDHGHGNHGN